MAEYRAGNDDEKLSIKSVLEETADDSDLSVLYASKIDVGAAEQAIDDYLSKVNENAKQAKEEISEVESILAGTNSKRFYSGETASNNIKNLQTASANMDTLLEKNNAIDKENIINVINQYNEKLKQLKKKCRLKYLQKAADDYNNGRHIKSTQELKVQKDYCSPAGDYKHSKGFVEYNITYNNETYEDGIAYISYTLTKYDYINYWLWLTGDGPISSLGDDNVNKLEKKIKDRLGDLPYDTEKLVDC